MKKARFFALLHFARKLNQADKVSRQLAATSFLIGYNTALQSREKEYWATRI